MSTVFTLTEQFDNLRGFVEAIGTIAASANYATGGDTLDLTGKGIVGVKSAPIYGEVHGKAGFHYAFDPGTTMANGKVIARPGLPQHTHDLLVTGGQAAGNALQELATVVGKIGAGNVTAAGGASNIQNVAAAAAPELAAAAYPAGVTGDTIRARFIFKKS